MRHSLTFIGGVILGAGLVLTAGYMAGFERPVHQAVPMVARVQPQTSGGSGWEDFLAVERSIPKDLQACVARESAMRAQREMARHQSELAFGLERALYTCLAMRNSPTVAQK